ncbi:DUF3040 domain-containing protein [Kitasatospora sp. NPDC096147]|uniref:DUF3040 domain-containing protein n=1 Tax=Kitasatospora sp. NPDC096147 TaxID=3364093 RepID=UPI00382F1967
MEVHLTATELRLLRTIEESLRRTDPSLDRRLRRPAGRLRRLGFRPAALVATVLLLSLVAEGCTVVAVFHTAWAAVPAVLAGLLVLGAFRRLAGLRLR